MHDTGDPVATAPFTFLVPPDMPGTAPDPRLVAAYARFPQLAAGGVIAVGFTEMIAHVSDVIALIGVDGTIEYVSPGAKRMSGYEPGELIGRRFVEFVHPDDQKNAAKMIGEVLASAGTVTRGELRYRHKDGTWVALESIATNLTQVPEIGGIVVTARDVTARKQADESLRDTRERLQQMADNIGEVFWLTDSEKNQMLYVSPAYERIWGCPVERLYASPRDWLAAVHPDDRERILQAALHKQHAGTYDEEYRIVRPDGALRWIRDRAFPVLNAQGQVYRVAGIATDITEARRAQAAVLEAKEGLERQVAERTAELTQRNAELKDAMRAKNMFLANMSHELRTPLNSIIGFTGALLMKLPGPLNDEQEKQLGFVQGSAQHQLSLINDLLDLARIEAGKFEAALESLSCTEIVEETVATLRTLAQQKGLALTTRLPQGNPRVVTDRRALRQILINLCNNAIKFTDHGSVTVTVELRRTEGRDEVEISVADTGIGIGPADQGRLFDAFAQMDSSQREGTGLGLHLCRKLAGLLHGRIDFESKAGQGSRFWLTLPAA